MTLPRYLKGWFTKSNRLVDWSFHHLRQRLIFAYLLMMTAVLGVSGTALYIFFARSMSQQVDRRLETLVQAAAPSLNTIKSQGRQQLDRDLPWRELFFRRQQSIEWYGVEGNLLSKEGTAFPPTTLTKEELSSLESGEPRFQEQGQVRSAIIAVYTDGTQKDIIRLKGYIRASESTQATEYTLRQLQIGLCVGGSMAIFFIGISSVYLTRQALQPTLKSFQQLKQFAADASHELGGPLTKIGFATEILLNNPEQLNSSSGIKKVKIINNSAEQMKSLLEDLLFLARTDAASPLVRPEKSRIFVDELLQPLVEHYSTVAQKREIDFKTDLQPKLAIAGDSSQLNRLFTNLLSNAFKYTYDGGKVLLSANASEENAVISVEDTGIGIDAQYLPFVFQRFWRAERASKHEKGLGLGLAICKTIVKQHQGQITVKSEVNVGTCFKVELPLYK